MRRPRQKDRGGEGEFLWLVSLSDLMILLFVFFVTLFSFAYQKMGSADFKKIAEAIGNRPQQAQATPLDEIQAKLLKWVVDRKLMDSLQVEQKEDALILNIKEKVLFKSAEYGLREDSQELVQMIGSALSVIPAPYRIGVEGHTDDTPIGGSATDNWELSARRARSVLVALGLPEEVRRRAVVMGYGEMKPIAPNRDAQGRAIAENQAKNRRVTIRLF